MLYKRVKREDQIIVIMTSFFPAAILVLGAVLLAESAILPEKLCSKCMIIERQNVDGVKFVDTVRHEFPQLENKSKNLPNASNLGKPDAETDAFQRVANSTLTPYVRRNIRSEEGKPTHPISVREALMKKLQTTPKHIISRRQVSPGTTTTKNNKREAFQRVANSTLTPESAILPEKLCSKCMIIERQNVTNPSSSESDIERSFLQRRQNITSPDMIMRPPTTTTNLPPYAEFEEAVNGNRGVNLTDPSSSKSVQNGSKRCSKC